MGTAFFILGFSLLAVRGMFRISFYELVLILPIDKNKDIIYNFN
ncbi:TPA: hypothetical protein ACTZ5N_001838 [Bacillus cereus]